MTEYTSEDRAYIEAATGKPFTPGKWLISRADLVWIGAVLAIDVAAVVITVAMIFLPR